MATSSRGREKPTAALVLTARNSLAHATDEGDPALDTPDARVLAARFHELRRQGIRELVDLSVALGEVLIEAKARLGGSYRAFIRERLHIERSTAQNYVAMAKLARSAPTVVEKHKDLGASKLYQVARLEPAARSRVLAQPAIAGMTDREFADVIKPLRKDDKKVTANARANGLRQAIKSFTARLAEWKPGGHVTDAKLRQGLLEDLRKLRGAIGVLEKRV